MTAPTLERRQRDDHSDLVPLLMLWIIPVVGFVLAFLGLG